MLMMSIGMITALGITNVSAQYPVPEIVVYAPYGSTGTAGSIVYYQVNIKNAPHTDAEVTSPPDDKTWAWSVELTWDPTVLEAVDGMIFEDRDLWGPGVVYAWFGYFGTWKYVAFPPPAKWVKAEYPNAFVATIKSSEGYASIGCSLYSSPDPTTVALPPTSGWPQEGMHLGSYYDLPYTAGLPGDAYYPADELNLFFASFTVLKDGPPASSLVKIKSATFFGHDATTTYHVSTADAWFGAVGPYLHSVGSPIPDPSNPVGTSWHELYPTYCNEYDLTDWEDNGDEVLSYCDNITLNPTEPAGTPWVYHVEEVTTTITVSLKPDLVETMYVDLELGPDVDPYLPINEPLNTQWHELYPDYCKRYHLTEWEDTGLDNPGELGPSDQIYLIDKETGVGAWYHVDDVSTDIIVKPEKPAAVPEFPLGSVAPIALIAVVAYIWWVTKRKTQKVM